MLLEHINRETRNSIFDLIFSFLEEDNAKLQVYVRKDKKIGCVYVHTKKYPRARMTEQSWERRWSDQSAHCLARNLLVYRFQESNKNLVKRVDVFLNDLVEDYSDMKLCYVRPLSY